MRVEITGHASYVFLDIVSFTQGRSVEAQQDIIGVLNNIIRESIKELRNPMPKDQVMFLPTGDGVCIALLSVQARFDLHLNTALDILERLDTYNKDTKDELRKFQVRIGLNSNVDNFIRDINGNRNVAGAGINNAQRLMGLADPGQIMVSDSDHQILRQREKYMKAFRGYSTEVKHGQRIKAYQYTGSGHEGLNTEVPLRFREPTRKAQRLTKLEAYYLAHALKNREFFVAERVADVGTSYYVAAILWQLANESFELSVTSEHMSRPARVRWSDRADCGMAEIYEIYRKYDFWVCCDLVSHVMKTELSSIRKFFADEVTTAVFVGSSGASKLKADWPDIWKEFNLDGCDTALKEQ